MNGFARTRSAPTGPDAASTTAAGVANPVDPTRRIRAVLFDLDGTLYRQRPLRVRMAVELLGLPLKSPRGASGRLRALRAYRDAQEHLRQLDSAGSIRASQLAAAADQTGLPVNEVDVLVREWMDRRPLKYLRRYRAAGIERLLQVLDEAGVRTGVLSDYPAESKLRALGLQDRFSLVLCSTDPEVDALKPSPKGFLRASRLWRLPPAEVLVVGDRPDVDAAGAAAAGMSCVIVGGSWARRRRAPNYLALSSIERLCDVLVSGR